jgi:hypothetical protein
MFHKMLIDELAKQSVSIHISNQICHGYQRVDDLSVGFPFQSNLESKAGLLEKTNFHFGAGNEN